MLCPGAGAITAIISKRAHTPIVATAITAPTRNRCAKWRNAARIRRSIGRTIPNPPLLRCSDSLSSLPVLNQDLIGKRYPEQRFEVTAAAVRAFALASNEDNPRYLDDSTLHGVVAPPMFAVVAAGPSEILPLFDEALTGPQAVFFSKMVRGDNDIVWSGPIRPGDVLSSVAGVTGVDVKPNGELLRVDVTLRRDGREVARVGCGYFVRGEGDAKPAKGAGTSPMARGPVVAAAEMQVTKDQPLVYADASGDRNPIH